MRLKNKILMFIITSILALPLALPTKALAAENVAAPPQIVGKTAITVDVKTGEILYALDVDKQKFPASTTKLLTGLILAENKKPNDTLTYTQSAKNQPTFSLNIDQHPLNVGQKFSADNAMKALLISSANDIAFMIADNIGGDQTGFAKMMNDRIKQMQEKYPYMKNTHFTTPNGVDNNVSDHLTTAYDLSVIGREAFKNQWVADTLKIDKTYIETEDGIKILAENRNRFIQPKDQSYDKTNIGGKTGYTAKAGRCLVSMFDRDGRKIIGVVMQSAYDATDQQVFSDMKKIIDYSYSLKPVTVLKKGDVLETKTVTYKLFKFFGPKKSISVPIVIDSDVSYYENDLNKSEIQKETKIDNLDPWKLNTENAVGAYNVSQREAKKSYKLYPSISSNSILKANMPVYLIVVIAILLVIAAVIAFFTMLLNRLPKSSKRNLYR